MRRISSVALVALAAASLGATLVPALSDAAPTAGSSSGRIKEYRIPSPGVPEGIAVGEDGAVWFSERYTDQVGRMTRQGAFKIYSFPPTRHMSTDITAGPDGALWFTFPNSAPPMDSGRIGRLTTAGDATFYDIPWTGDAESITAGPDGALWFADHVAAAVGRITTSGKISKFAIPGPRGAYPYNITAGPDGALWFTDFNERRIGRLTTAGETSFYPLPGMDGFPDAITAGPDGALWFTIDNTGRIGRITTAGAISEFPVPHPSGSYLALPGITAGPGGSLWFTYSDLTTGKSKVGRITTGGAVALYRTPSQSSGPQAITADADVLWFTEAAGRIGRIKPG